MASSKTVVFHDITDDGEITIEKIDIKVYESEEVVLHPGLALSQKRQFKDAVGEIITSDQVRITRREVLMADVPTDVLSALSDIRTFLYNAGLQDEGME